MYRRSAATVRYTRTNEPASPGSAGLTTNASVRAAGIASGIILTQAIHGVGRADADQLEGRGQDLSGRFGQAQACLAHIGLGAEDRALRIEAMEGGGDLFGIA